MNLNKVFIIGRLTADPEVRSTSTGQNVTTLRMATNRVWNDKAGQKQESAEYHTVVAWGRLGEVAGQYLKKGAMALIEGRIQTRSWTDQSNNKRYMTEIIAEGLQLGPRPAGSYSEASSRSAGPASTGGFRPTTPPSDIGSVRPMGRSGGSPVPDSAIPIIGADEPISAGVDEEERRIDEKDLPF